MWYVFDGNRNLADKDSAIVTGIYNKGETYTFDGIEVYCLLGTADTDHPLFIDKNHDLSYYFTGSDYVNEEESSSVINTANKYGYEWGGYGVTTGVTSSSVGSGLSNTNSLIGMNLQPYTDGWYVVWDKIKEFRQSHSDKWFLPSMNELRILDNGAEFSNLNNLSISPGSPYLYWSSSEGNSSKAGATGIYDSYSENYPKNYHGYRARLCYTI